VGIGLIAAILVTLFVARELWTGVAFTPWAPHGAANASGADRRVTKKEQPQAYWLAVGLHCVMIAVAWGLLFMMKK